MKFLSANIVTLLILVALQLNAQQDPQISQYMFNKVYYNPGAAGNNEGICVNGLIRQQWAGFKDPEGNKVSPESFLITADAPLNIVHGGLSLVLLNDKIGFWQDIDLKLGYTYRANLGSGKLGVGLQFGFFNRTVDFSKYITIDDDPLISKLSSEENDMLFDLALGAYYEVPDQYYVGISALDLLQSQGKPLLVSGDGGNEFKYVLDRSVYLTGGYYFTLPNNPMFEIIPSFLLKIGQATNQIDFTTLVEYNDKFWGGVSYRLQESIVVILGMNYKNFRIGYSYDIVTNGYGLGGTHEITAGYCFKLEFEKARKIYHNTRFL